MFGREQDVPVEPMTKAGEDYQQIVGTIRRALDPGAKVTVGDWIVGPDGRRDMDVSIRGFKDGIGHFVLIECKDWKDRVGIETIDALDSKKRDLSADLAIIYSNSGFTEPALNKARRLDIEAASALAHKDKRIKVGIYQEVLAKELIVKSWSLRVWPNQESDARMPSKWDPRELYYHDLPVVNWIAQASKRLLKDYENYSEIRAKYAFREEKGFSLSGTSIILRGLEITLYCGKGWVSQNVPVDVTLGSYDYLRKRIALPNQQAYILGPIDKDKWQETNRRPEEKDLEPGTFEIHLTLFKSVAAIQGAGIPPIEEIIGKQEINVC